MGYLGFVTGFIVGLVGTFTMFTLIGNDFIPSVIVALAIAFLVGTRE